jgi:hypothetical protein
LSYKVTVRRGPKVEHAETASLDGALRLAEEHARTSRGREAVEFMSRRYEPGDLVAVRIELKGPRVRAGLDVRGDGSVVAWTGRMRRAIVDPTPGESPYAALRRTLQRVKVEP